MSGQGAETEVRLAVGDLLLRSARRLTEDYIRIWYFDEEPLDVGDQTVLDNFMSTYRLNSRHTAWVAFQDGQAIGSCLLDDDGEFLKVMRLFVRRSHRRTGAGKALLEAVMRHSDLMGRSVRAVVPEKRSEALALLLSLGFAETGVVINSCIEVLRPCEGPLFIGASDPIEDKHVETLLSQLAEFLGRTTSEELDEQEAAAASVEATSDPSRGGRRDFPYGQPVSESARDNGDDWGQSHGGAA